MSDQTFQAMVVTETESGQFEREIKVRSIDDLPAGEILIRVQYSSLNYKDALSASGNRGVTRSYPHTPGIDAAGVVVDSGSDAFSVGDEVVVIGFDLGMNTAGGFGEYVRVPAGWVVKLPQSLSIREAMVYGTAGFTAAMCVDKIVRHGVRPEDGEILVTGATGGVGSFSVALLAQLGYRAAAATGKAETAGDYLHRLGADSVLSRSEVTDESGRPLLKSRWVGVIDSVGGELLASALKATSRDAAVAICGLAASADLPTTVLPFILRSVTMYGVDSVQMPIQERARIWELIAGDWKLPNLSDIAREVTLDALAPEIERILAGKQVGRVLVTMAP